MKGERRVTVLGAGYSGLTTACELTLRGWTVDIKVHNVSDYFIADTVVCCSAGRWSRLPAPAHHSGHPVPPLAGIRRLQRALRQRRSFGPGAGDHQAVDRAGRQTRADRRHRGPRHQGVAAGGKHLEPAPTGRGPAGGRHRGAARSPPAGPPSQSSAHRAGAVHQRGLQVSRPDPGAELNTFILELLYWREQVVKIETGKYFSHLISLVTGAG